jgi:hypothetical protein
LTFARSPLAGARAGNKVANGILGSKPMWRLTLTVAVLVAVSFAETANGNFEGGAEA